MQKRRTGLSDEPATVGATKLWGETDLTSPVRGDQQVDASTAADGAPALTRKRRLAVLALTFLVYFFYLLDRNAIIVTQELFKQEFVLSDTQVGLITGVLYGVAYAAAGIPIGWLIQRTSKVKLLALLVAVWSGVTVLCGLATQFWHLAAARVLVGAAESGGAPVSLSIVQPMFDKSRRAMVSSVFFAGAGVGVIVSFLAGGFIAEEFGWRAVFFIYGAPGLLLAAAILLVVPEPPRVPVDVAIRSNMFSDALAVIGNRRLMPIYLGAVVCSFVNAGMGAWMVSFLMRVHDFSLPQAGAAIALGLGVFGTAGSLAIGYLADKAEARRTGGLLIILALCSLANGLAGIAAALAGSPALAILCLSLWGLTAIAYSGPSNAAIGNLAPPHLLGAGFSMFAVLCNLIGSGLGPLLAGGISDVFAASMESDSLRPAMAAIACFQIVAMGAFLLAARRQREVAEDNR
jgi:MFS family permease